MNSNYFHIKIPHFSTSFTSTDHKNIKKINNDEIDINGIKKIGNYKLGSELGSGAFGKVVLGKNILTNQTVAIKILDKFILSQTPEDYELVHQEISILKIVKHKYIAQLYEILETSQFIFIVIEYCEGKDLMDYILKKSKLSEKEALKFFQQLINTLLYLHSQNIAHRDIKIDNMLLDKERNLKLVDFGLSTKYSDDELLNQPCGTVVYAAPEVLDGKDYHGMLADVWSSGIVLYGMISGFLPFCDNNDEINKKNVLQGKIDIPDFFPILVKDLLKHMLDINPMTRYTLQEIRDHPWFNDKNYNMLPGIVIGYNKIPIDEKILKQCENYGFNKGTVKKSVLGNKFDSGSALYYLLVKKGRDKGEESVSDLCSDEYIKFALDENNIIRDFEDGNNVKNNSACNNNFHSNIINNSNTNISSNNNNYNVSCFSNRNETRKETKNTIRENCFKDIFEKIDKEDKEKEKINNKINNISQRESVKIPITSNSLKKKSKKESNKNEENKKNETFKLIQNSRDFRQKNNSNHLKENLTLNHTLEEKIQSKISSIKNINYNKKNQIRNNQIILNPNQKNSSESLRKEKISRRERNKIKNKRNQHISSSIDLDLKTAIKIENKIKRHLNQILKIKNSSKTKDCKDINIYNINNSNYNKNHCVLNSNVLNKKNKQTRNLNNNNNFLRTNSKLNNSSSQYLINEYSKKPKKSNYSKEEIKEKLNHMSISFSNKLLLKNLKENFNLSMQFDLFKNKIERERNFLDMGKNKNNHNKSIDNSQSSKSLNQSMKNNNKKQLYRSGSSSSQNIFNKSLYDINPSLMRKYDLLIKNININHNHNNPIQKSDYYFKQKYEENNKKKKNNTKKKNRINFSYSNIFINNLNNSNKKMTNNKYYIGPSVVSYRKKNSIDVRDLSDSPNHFNLLNDKTRISKIPWKVKKD